MDDEVTTREKALKTVVQGQQAENLLDFDEPDANSSSGSGIPTSSSGLASIIMGGGASANPQTAKILTSSNPLDDLVSIFGNANLGPPSASLAPIVASPVSAGGLVSGGMATFGATGVAPAQSRKPQDDLLDLF